jgi:hypothetical protein
MWDYICPKCRKSVEKTSIRCPYCGEQYGNPVRVPPRLLKDPKALEDYVHKHIFSRISRSQRDYLAQYFTELFSDIFDSDDFSAWDGTSNTSGDTLETVDAPVNEGDHAAHAQVDGSGDHAYCYVSVTGQDEIYVRMYVRYPSSVVSDAGLEIFLYAGGSARAFFRLLYPAQNGTYIKLYNYVTSNDYDSSTFNTSTDTWYCIELGWKKGSSDGFLKAWFDGELEIEETGLNTGTNDIDTVRCGIGYAWRAVEIYFDSVVIADTYIGPESETYTKIWTTDALFKKLGITKTLSVDTAFQKQDIPKIFGLDSTFQKSFTTQKQLDVLFKKLDNLETFGIDADFLKRDITKSFALDAHFGALMTQTISRQIDVLLKKLDVTKTFGLDVYFESAEAETYTKNFALDVIFAYKVRLPELWLDENGKLVLNISKPYTWVGT